MRDVSLRGTANPAGASWLQSARLVAAVAELGSLGGMSRPCYILTVFLAALCASCGGDHDAKERDAFLSLPYRQFDQTPGSGWRAMAERQQFAEAAKLVEAYLALHPELAPKERALLHFHAAQLLAVASRESEALAHLEHTAVPDDTPGFPAFPGRWNDFVAATKAFLLRDRSGLIAARARMASGPSNPTDLSFLNGVDLLISRFGDSYRDVYLSPRSPRK
jgi:hypothetical protein